VDQIGFEEQWLNIWPPLAGKAETLVDQEVLDALAGTVNITSTSQGRTYVIYPNLEQTAWYVLASAMESDGETVLLATLGNHRTLSAAVKQVAALARTGTNCDLLIPRHVRGRVPRMAGVRQTIHAGEQDVAAATTSIRPWLLAGRVRHDGDVATSEQMVGAVLETYGETKRVSGKASPNAVHLAKAAVLGMWWASREDKPSAVVV
jgi:hypothetical protein